MKKILLVAACYIPLLTGQPADHTQLKQVIVFGRHAVRTPNASNVILDNFSALPYPDFAVPGVAVITPNGQANETKLGAYFRLWLTQEKLLTGNDAADNASMYFRADGAPLIVSTAQAFATGLLPAATVNIQTTTSSDPLFHPVEAGVAVLDEPTAVAAVNGRLGGNPQALATAYAAELALARSVLFNYPAGTTPAPATPVGKIDLTAAPIGVTAGSSALPVNLGGLESLAIALDPFVMEYADGMAASAVGWGQLDAASISQVDRLYDRVLDLEFRTPYIARVQNSNLAAHILQSMLQSATANPMTGALGAPADKAIVLTASNFNITGFASLLGLEWLVQGYQANVAAPGGALVFELRQSQTTGEFLVRAVYITQTLDQLRNVTPLSLASPPAIAPVFIPGCSVRNATFDCPLAGFAHLVDHAVDPRSVDLNE